MKIAELKRLPDATAAAPVIRTTAGQDAPIENARSHWRSRRWLYIGAGAGVLLIVTLVWLLSEWSDLQHTISADRLRVVSVRWTIEVADRGSGLDDEVLRDALLPFYSTKPSGAGLGLTLCREIVEAHGGRLGLANREGGGAAMTIWLPEVLPTSSSQDRSSHGPSSHD
jgi:signal transduction histidine kinase